MKTAKEAKEAAGHGPAHLLETKRPATFEPTDDAIRSLMQKMRNVTQEERFRSGRIR